MHPSSHPSAPIVANMHVQSIQEERLGLRELASGVDALFLSGHGYLSKGFLGPAGRGADVRRPGVGARPLRAGTAHARAGSPRLGQVPLLPRPRAVQIGFTSSRRLPSVRIQPGPSSSMPSGRKKRCDFSPTWCDRSLKDWS